MILYGTFARFTRSDDYPFGYPQYLNEQWLGTLGTNWGTDQRSRSFAPDRADDPELVRTMARFERMAMSPGTAKKLPERRHPDRAIEGAAKRRGGLGQGGGRGRRSGNR